MEGVQQLLLFKMWGCSPQPFHIRDIIHIHSRAVAPPTPRSVFGPLLFPMIVLKTATFINKKEAAHREDRPSSSIL